MADDATTGKEEKNERDDDRTSDGTTREEDDEDGTATTTGSTAATAKASEATTATESASTTTTTTTAPTTSMAPDGALRNVRLDVAVCCYDDGSTDGSLALLKGLQARYGGGGRKGKGKGNDDCDCDGDGTLLTARLLVGSSPDGSSRGAGYARNRAASLRRRLAPVDDRSEHFLCLLDSDDVMHRHRIAEQVAFLLALPPDERRRTLLGCTFRRIPEGSTWHYAKWLNGLSDERLYLERFREVTLLQPTWCCCRRWFEDRIGGYVEAPVPPPPLDRNDAEDGKDNGATSSSLAPTTAPPGASSPAPAPPSRSQAEDSPSRYRLIHPIHDDRRTLRLAEDLRFFHAHLNAGGRLRLVRTPIDASPLVAYRHRPGVSQSSSTSRRLLLRLRAKAWEDAVVFRRCDASQEGNGGTTAAAMATTTNLWSSLGFAVWGAGRDGKDFVKSLSPDAVDKVRCLVDVDRKKIDHVRFYDNPNLPGLTKKIPILHFSALARDSETRERVLAMEAAEAKERDEGGTALGRINKGRGCDRVVVNGSTGRPTDDARPTKRRKRLPPSTTGSGEGGLDYATLARLPVVVCVAMYRTNGALERNVASIGRTEGQDLWHFC